MVQPELMTVNAQARKVLINLHADLEAKLDRDVVAIVGPIMFGVEQTLREAIDATVGRRPRLAVVLHTGGGIVEVAERIVNVLRHFYQDVAFIIPDVALSAGTVLAMSGDELMMDYYSCLGPIDPQVQRDNKLVPALSYLVQFDRLMAKAQAGTATTADLTLLAKLDLAELHKFEMAAKLSRTLLVKWLAKYKFKDWTITESTKKTVSQKDREQRAEEIARKLGDHEHWGSHGRGIPMDVLQTELNLRITDFGATPALSAAIRDYFKLLTDFMVTNEMQQLVHAKNFL